MTAQPLTHAFKRGAAFLAGVSFAAVPAVGPFLAVLAILTGRIEIHKADVWWWFTGLLFGVPLVLTGYPVAGALATAQVLAVWLLYRSATALRAALRSETASADIGMGLVVGLTVTLALGLQNIGGLRFDSARTVLDAIVWQTDPALFGHSILTLSTLLAIVVPSPRLRFVALALGAVGVVVSGSREAVWAWLIISVGLRFVGRRGSRFIQIAEWALVAVMALLVSGLASQAGLGRTGFLTAYTPTSVSDNLFRGTEIGNGDWWLPLGVEFTTDSEVVEGQDRTVYTVTKEWGEPWSRLQQAITLVPGTTYTLSATVNATEGTRPGFDGWGRASSGSEAANLATIFEGGVHRATSMGAIHIASSSAITLDDEWQRLYVTFDYTGESPLTWYVGVLPDRSDRVGSATRFTEFQLTTTYSLLPYRPGLAVRGVTDLRTSRFPIWRDALQAISARPILGWGPDGFPRAVDSLHPDETLLRPVAAHSHNAVLNSWVNSGVFGALGVFALFALLALRAVQQRDRASLIVLLGVAVLNTFDATLFSGGVIYPLAAVLGWRAVGRRVPARTETGFGSSLAVRFALAGSDVAVGAMSLALGLATANALAGSGNDSMTWSWPLAYLTLAWPAVAGSASQYPGYGRMSYQELATTVKSAAGASIIAGFISMLLPDTFGLSAQVFLVAVPVSAMLGPLFRSLTKQFLRNLRLWGRPVVVLGTEESAARVTRHLLSSPAIGLLPVAVFGNQDTWNVRDLPVTGSLDHAWDYIGRYGIRHAIVTPDASVTAAFDQVLLQSRTHLKYVQYLPDLRSMPTHSVVAAQLGTALALEARNQLASGANRAIKRTIDLAGSFVLLVLLGIPLAVIAGIIRLDSRGSPLYLSPRIGRYGRLFNCIKFRTMHLDADERLGLLLSEHPELRTEYERFHKLENDPRVTRVGRTLRRLSLDELPQLFNVLLGQMSLVGPRPYMEREHEIMGNESDLIFLARPGMTGYWQVGARNDVTFAERQSMEAHYVRNWSLWWDIDILLRTPAAMVGKTGK